MARTIASTRTSIRKSTVSLGGNSLVFDGATSYVQVSSQLFFQNTGYTVSFWIRTTNISSGNRMLCLGSSSSNNPIWIIETQAANGGRIDFNIRNDAGTGLSVGTLSTVAINDGNWHHIVATDNNGTLKLYIDGVQDPGNFNYTRSGSLTINRTGIGALIRAAITNWVNGQMDDVRIWNNTVLSSADVAALYAAGTNPSTPTSWYKFDEGSGTTATDNGSLATNGTINAATYSTNVPSYVIPELPRGYYLIDSFADTPSVAIDKHLPSLSSSPSLASSSWAQTASNSFKILGGKLVPNRYTNADVAVIDVGTGDCTVTSVMTPFSDGTNAGTPALVFRYLDASNYWYADVNAKTGTINVHKVVATVDTTVFTYTQTVTSGVPVTIRIDCIGTQITLFINGFEINNIVDTFNQTATKVGARIGVTATPGTNATWTSIKAQPFAGIAFNWPVFTRSVNNPQLSLGASYDSHDLNDPNVVFDPVNNRYAMYWSAYGGANPQTMGVGYSATLDGGWTKEPSNPVYSSGQTDDYGEDGGLAYFKGKWWHTYMSSLDTKMGMTSSTNLKNWTDHGEVLSPSGSWCSGGISGHSLRVSQDGQTLHAYFDGRVGGTFNGIGHATSTDGTTWVMDAANPIFVRPSGYPAGGYEPNMFVPAGKEGVEYLVSWDSGNLANNVGIRVINQSISVDGGATWHHRYGVWVGSGSGWDTTQVFDPYVFPTIVNGNMYLFYCGANVVGGAVDLNGQMGLAIAPWNFTSLRKGNT